MKEYEIETPGEKSCVNGSMILGAMECEAACSQLGIGPIVSLSDGNACYQAGNGKCRQDGRQGKSASLVCMNVLGIGIKMTY